MTTTPSKLPDLDYQRLDKELDRTKTKVFIGNNAAFLGPLMCSMDFVWDERVPTACTNGLKIWWNPHWFLTLKPEVRQTVLVHELWHPGFLHMLRCGTRDPKIWNYAADIVINNMLDSEGYSFEGTSPWLDHAYDGWTTEAIYDDLYQHAQKVQQFIGQFGTGGLNGDLTDDPDGGPGGNTAAQEALSHTILNNVVAASHHAALAGKATGNLPGEVETTLKEFLSPKLPWHQLLHNFFHELSNQDYSWSRPNRRYQSQDLYLPAMVDDHQGLDHLAYFFDVSLSVTDPMVIRFHSEFKYVKETFQPEKMTMVQFDTKIQKEDVFLKDDPFEETVIKGRGGTSLVCVRDWIIEHQPTAVVVFSDMEVTPMQPLPQDRKVPIIWISLNNSRAKVNEGQLVHLSE